MITDGGKQVNELIEINLTVKASVWHDSKEEAFDWLQKLIYHAFYNSQACQIEPHGYVETSEISENTGIRPVFIGSLKVGDKFKLNFHDSVLSTVTSKCKDLVCFRTDFESFQTNFIEESAKELTAVVFIS